MEVLVILVVLAVISGMAMLSVGLADSAEKIEREAKRIAELIKLQCEQSQLQGQRGGFELHELGYSFSQWQQDRWHRVAQRPFQERLFAVALQPELSVNGYASRLTNDPIRPNPQVICYESGELTPFKLALRDSAPDSATGFVVAGELNGDVQTQSL